MSIHKEDLRAVRVNAKAASADELAPTIEKQSPPALQKGEALVRVRSAGVNPSDVKAALGIMPQAVFPRTPGRDFAGVVVDGPSAWVGKEVWGSGGDVGQTVAIMGANGKVGQAAVQLAAQAGANVIAVRRGGGEWDGPSKGVHTIDAKTEDVAARIRELSDGKGAHIVFNTVGSPYFEAANKAMAKGATQIFISTIERPVPFDIFTFYRGMHTYVGIDTLALNCIETNDRMEAMRAGFEADTLHPFEVSADAVFSLDQVLAVYKEVLGGASRRVVFNP
jgi:NADPH2:quinone reductase